jgi:hypothetical protein
MTMVLSTLDASGTRAQHSRCPHCGRTIDLPRLARVETGLNILAGLVLALTLMLLAVIAWKSSSDFLSDEASHSMFYHPLED